MKLSQLQTQVLWMFIILGICYVMPLLFGHTGIYPHWIVAVTVLYFSTNSIRAFRRYPDSHTGWPGEPGWKRFIRVLLP